MRKKTNSKKEYEKLSYEQSTRVLTYKHGSMRFSDLKWCFLNFSDFRTLIMPNI